VNNRIFNDVKESSRGLF